MTFTKCDRCAKIIEESKEETKWVFEPFNAKYAASSPFFNGRTEQIAIVDLCSDCVREVLLFMRGKL